MTDADDQRVTLSDGPVYVSHYPRRMLVDEGTGMWCQNCPSGMLELDRLHREFGDNVIAVATHCNADQDPLTNDPYWQGLGFYAAPYFRLDRIRQSASGSASGLDAYYDRPVEFRITISGLESEGNDAVKVTASVESAVPADNSADRYRIGYVLTSDFYCPGDRKYYQQNDVTNPSGGRFYFMPKRIPGDMIVFHDVSLTSDNAFEGIAGSLPAELLPGERYEFSWTVDRPELLEDIADGRMVVYLLDSVTGEIFNADSAGIRSFSSVADVEPDGSLSPSVKALQGGQLGVYVPTEEPFSLTVYDMNGARCAVYEGGKGMSVNVVRHDLPSGIYVAVLKTEGGICSTRLLITNN